MRQQIGSVLIQIMACRLFGAKPLSEPSWVIVIWTFRNKLQWNCNQNTNFFIHENASKNIVCEMVAILSMGRWVNKLRLGDTYMHQWTGSSLLQIMACHLFGAKEKVSYCQLNYFEIWINLLEFWLNKRQVFFVKKMYRKYQHQSVIFYQASQC